ncbi:hypothetical protein THASP1DRAFT_32923 [Thamnocephalis sphaerospora]|uniref:Uncharacterized protein n=1 Tax=Thamnocephalis sphaerospora TaxID=78915 RepID=A0A4P9XHU1_9FUNG|nr:hypothetical protein THASP1DRAFT_32923 [Thamnocephalis sphaerospora]|eukprot:RKP05238.1 hypothetical protein THASP1DRAFT_32923 [Thamnocephalis sphaerospora]
MTDSCLQFLSDEQKLVTGVEKLANDKWNLNDWGVDYNIVAVCGQPGSGKSTLANALFGTQFPALSEGGEQPTTKASALIFNVQKILIENDPKKGISFLLARIFKAHLTMLKKKHKTMILFVARDCNDGTSKQALTSTLDKRIKSAWAEVKKSDDLESCAFDDIFDYDVVTLPSKIDAPDEFDAAVDKLRGRLINEHNPGYLFKPSYWKAVSADRIASHLANLRRAILTYWSVLAYETFSSAKDAPTLDTKEKYAAEKKCCLFEGQYRNHMDGFYDMAIHYAYNEFLKAVKPIQEEIDTKGIEDEYLKQLVGYQRNAMVTFSTVVEHHQDDMHEAKRNELRSKCNEKITSLVCEQTPWSSTGLAMQLVVDRTLQKQENTIQARVQQEVERRTKEMELNVAQLKAELDQQSVEIDRLKAEGDKKSARISEQITKIGALEAANGEKDTTIDALKADNDKKDIIISALKAEKEAMICMSKATNNEKETVINAQKAENSEKEDVISALKVANDEKDTVITALETEAEVQDGLIAICKRDVSKLRMVIDKQDIAIDELTGLIREQETVINEQKATATIGALLRRMIGHEGGVWTLAVCGDTVVSGNTDRAVRVCDVADGRCTHMLEGHTSTVRCCKIIMSRRMADGELCPSKPILVTGNRDTTLRVWWLPSPRRDPPWMGTTAAHVADPAVSPPADPYLLYVWSDHTGSVRAVDGWSRRVVSGSYDCTVRV